ncbi:MAG: bifunctional tRNA (5-methylaminomethyl-2-thiouridine)(34)-methyltransferase MnmD/FAD-dependent 5-carboxymethylaminomethyl-2-thiouridine(34) oxidoreductase MnmC, partial [Proteobacteria bacterium]|nr:bifunctional tRNA (5-methylaminomethyl-2-thiouridine)(34)-methyltransferase MnmD/FAD-dependent 5-carboxymethylaminomethyl-2-thiouridine(34) oxidoreductase MnmC [Pseudomonadota bacterium]
MPPALVPATPAFSPDGTPYSAAYGDVYHSSEGGPAQAAHVFLGGNGLPERWRGRARFTILETGFGLGVNFLATWAALRADPAGPARLHYVAVEKHPFSAEDLGHLHARHPQFAALSTQLRAAWPMLVPGMHRLELDSGRVVLTLYFGDVSTALPQLRLAADAFFLDGFSPAKNPEMWAPSALKHLGKLAAQDATCATYTAAAAVRDSLAAAGFAVDKRPGFARKRDMLCGRHARGPALPAGPDRRAMVIGAGLAGSAVCERLAARGWAVTLIERNAAPAREASGNHAGAFHPLVTRDDSIIAQLSRAAFLHALRQWDGLAGVSWDRCGVLQMPRTAEEETAQRAALETLGYPPGYARWLTRAEASQAAGTGVAEGGLWFEQGGWMRPPSLVAALLAKANVSMHFGIEVKALGHTPSGWAALDGNGKTVAEAPIVVLANARDAMRLAPLEHAALRSVRGQVSYLPAEVLPAIRAVLLRGGMALPPVDGIVVAGASYDPDDDDAGLRTESHAGNLARFAKILPGSAAAFDPAALAGRVAFRAVAHDRLPVVGPHPQMPGVHCAFAYASRGILWCALMAELLASRLESEPLPL